MADLITLSRATELIPNFPSADNTVMQDIVDSASALIEKWCNRTFAVTSYDDLYDGTGHFNLILDHYPIVSIDRVLYNPVNVLQVQMIDPTNQVSRASFRLDGTTATPPAPNNLYLEWMRNGVLNQQTITINGNGAIVTLSDLATAINAFSASGWKAQALGVYSNFAVSDLRPPQGASECKWFGTSYLFMHTFALPQYSQRVETGEIVSPMGFARGYQNFRVVYTAGFSTVPLEVQQACAELAAAVYKSREQNAHLQSENLDGYSYTALTEKTFNNLSIASRYALYQYKASRVVKFRTVP